MAPLADDSACTIIMQNLVFSICHLHSILEKNPCIEAPKFWSSLEHSAQDQFQKAFADLDPIKGRRVLSSFISDVRVHRDQHQHPFIPICFRNWEKNSFQMEATQMKIVFNCFKSISLELFGYYDKDSIIVNDDSSSYAYQMLLPLYRVCEGCTGKVVSDDLRLLAHEVLESFRVIMGNHFVKVYTRERGIRGNKTRRSWLWPIRNEMPRGNLESQTSFGTTREGKSCP